MPKQSKRRQKPVDARQLLHEIQSRNPEPPLNVDDLLRRRQHALRSRYHTDPNLLIQDFVSCFGYRNGKATLSVRPDDSMLEIIAEAFRRYWTRREGSLDDAFGFRKGKGRGKAREQEQLRVQKFKAQIAYEELREQGMLKKKAIEKIADFLKCSEHKAHSLIFRSGRKRAVTSPSLLVKEGGEKSAAPAAEPEGGESEGVEAGNEK